MNGKETLKTRGFLFLPTDIFDIPSLKFTTPEIAEKFALPMTKLEQRFDDTCSMAKYLIDFARDVDQIIEHLIQAVRDGDQAKQKWLNHCLAMRVLFQYHVDVFDYVFKSNLSFPSKHAQSTPQQHPEQNNDSGDNTAQRTDETERANRPKKIEVVRCGKAPKDAREFKFFDKNNLPLLSFDGVRCEIGGEPQGVNPPNSVNRPKDDWITFVFYRPLLNENDVRRNGARLFNLSGSENGFEWKGRPFLIGLRHIHNWFSEDLKEELGVDLQKDLELELRDQVDQYVQCPPHHTVNKFISGRKVGTNHTTEIGWIAFDENGKQLRMNESALANKSANQLREHRSKNLEISGWTCDFGKLRCDDDLAWGLSGEEATAEVTIEEARKVISERRYAGRPVQFYPKISQLVNPDREEPDRFPNAGNSTPSADLEDNNTGFDDGGFNDGGFNDDPGDSVNISSEHVSSFPISKSLIVGPTSSTPPSQSTSTGRTPTDPGEDRYRAGDVGPRQVLPR